ARACGVWKDKCKVPVRGSSSETTARYDRIGPKSIIGSSACERQRDRSYCATKILDILDEPAKLTP
ncbi:hypothetical protein KAX17_02605, partial [Candidatus Bipolaricaulota bacterium]|nr:hypothetical protein [Candidatus Bipolaricaulota bacterium]